MRAALASRAADMMCRKHPEFEWEITLRQVEYLHGRFFEHRIDGPRLPIPNPD